MAQDVVARFDVCGNLYEPGAVIGDEDIGRPKARVGAVDVADLVDLEELQRCLIDRLTVAVARREVVKDGPVVGVRPGNGPLDEDGVACVDGGVSSRRGGVLVADDVAGLVGVGCDEAVVCVGGGPAYDDGRIGFVRVGGWVVALPVDAVNDEVVDVGVGNSRGGQGEAAQDGW